jgi:hypothetical protein
MKTLIKHLASAFLFCAALNANAQTAVPTYYECKLAFPSDIIAACPLLKKGDTATIIVSAFPGKAKANLGSFTFSTAASSGVPVTGQGTLIASTSGGTFVVTALTIGDPLGATYSFVNLNISLSAKVYTWRPHPGGWF